MKFEEYLEKRVAIFDRLFTARMEELAQKEKQDIEVETTYGVSSGLAWETTPFAISKAVNPKHSEFIVAKVNGALWDAHRVLEESAKLEFLTFDSEEGKKVFWHSSAHVLGESCEKCFGCNLCLGPPTDSGFFYEMEMKKTVVPDDYKALQKEVKTILKENQKFVRLEMSKEDLLEMFSENPLKLELINAKVEKKSTVYRCGPLIDFCLGPHVPSTSYIKALEITNHSSSFFLGDASRPVLQRVYGISFPSKAQMAEHLKMVEEAAKYNHRRVGTDLNLFFFSPVSPGSCFFLPKGAFVYNSLIKLIKDNYRSRGFKEVVTPNILTNDLWKTSGHWENYKDDMFCFAAEGTEMALKPMNCPSHCVMFKHMSVSYKDLPLRMADFGVLHRNELSGTLTGLTRVRRFQQDDAHIFVQPQKVMEEILMSLEFLKSIYDVLGFTYTVKLSTRPDNYLGELEVWNAAEDQLKEALDAANCQWELNEGDGAFYGPKIDISVGDAMGRKHQCGTIQLDFQMPIRFDLKFANAEQALERPVMIHRAILGSIERVTGILLEHFKGRLPPWLNPNQVCIIPVSGNDHAYADKVAASFADFEVFTDLSDSTIGKKVLNAEKQRYSFIFIVGANDRKSQTVSLRIAKESLVISGQDALVLVSEAVKHRVASTADSLRFLPKHLSPTKCLNNAVAFLERLLNDLKLKAVNLLRLT
ncbi:threonyl-tRNA synthetase [Nematocida displodere]|uniref:Probable threonine--tRNA ligase, cytoplasmic n=1 Tax=Nematocida displodere TaxID=1805483 RepID=A0A177EC36_9MICR|nr:threonyl-tRNA synthetase [Nematocida displodere]